MNERIETTTNFNITEADLALDIMNAPEAATVKRGYIETIYGGGVRFVMPTTAFEMLLDSLQNASIEAIYGPMHGTAEGFLKVLSDFAIPLNELFANEVGKFSAELQDAAVEALSRSDTNVSAEFAKVLIDWDILPETLAELHRSVETVERHMNELAEKALAGSDHALKALLAARASCVAAVSQLEKATT